MSKKNYNNIGFKNKDIDKVSFDDAFSSSKSQGKITFDWRGNKYNTTTADELVKKTLSNKTGPVNAKKINSMEGTAAFPHYQYKNLNTTNVSSVKKSINQKLKVSENYSDVYPYKEGSRGPSITRTSPGYMVETVGTSGNKHFNFGRGEVTKKADLLMKKALNKISKNK